MRTAAKSAIRGALLAAALAFPALAQLDLPCGAFARADDGTWYATQQVTVDTAIGLVEVLPGPVSLEVADVLNAVCQ
jgi:hypothetical protein